MRIDVEDEDHGLKKLPEPLDHLPLVMYSNLLGKGPESLTILELAYLLIWAI